MATLLTIGEFARMTYLSVKALRHYDDVGLLSPADIDPASGYRRYAVAQVPTAQAIRRFRDLDMPLERIRAVLGASDPGTRDRIVLEHLREMEAKLDHTQNAVASLRALLEGTPVPSVDHRIIPGGRSAAITARVAWDDAGEWLSHALDELSTAVGLADRAGTHAALYDEGFFEDHVGEVTALVPILGGVVPSGRVTIVDRPDVAYAVMVHDGPFESVDTVYGALGAHVTERGVGAPGPIRENYLEDARIEVCWPILRLN
jgi:DNA-binding transcriptional MerR regulator